MPVAGTAKNFHLSAFFELQIDAMKSVEVEEISELVSELNVLERYEGGSVLPITQLGRAKRKELTITRGQSGDQDWWIWHSMAVQQTAAGVGSDTFGLSTDKLARNGDIVQKDRDGTVLARWTFAGAKPFKYTTGKWGADEFVKESLTLVFDYFDKTL